MEYYVGLEGRKLEVEWNGADLNRLTFIRYSSRAIHYKCYLYLPRMPTNHTICMKKRLERAWKSRVGSDANSKRRIITALNQLKLKNGLHIQDDILLPLLEKLNLNDVAPDLNIIGFYQSGCKRQRKLLFVFGFYPDNESHYLEKAVIRGDLVNYGRNGDLSLQVSFCIFSLKGIYLPLVMENVMRFIIKPSALVYKSFTV